jgi:hypothetical protein
MSIYQLPILHNARLLHLRGTPVATATIFHTAEAEAVAVAVAVAVAEDLLNNSPHSVPLAKFVKNKVIPLLHAGTALIKTTRLILLL